MAIRFEKGFGIPAGTMLRMQAAWDLAQAESLAYLLIHGVGTTVRPTGK